jgi:uncharacterized protein (TIGR02453 family)
MPTTPSKFTGFADTKARFFHQLAKNMSREWFAAHKAEYEEGWAQPMLALMTEVASKLDASYPDVELEPPKVFRLHRDVRFSKDKSPYKTNVSGVLSVKRKGSITEVPAALYLQIGTEGMVAAGQYGMSGEGLARYRAALLDDVRGPEIAKIVKRLEKDGFTPGAMETLKKPPRGVPPEHPRASLLQLKGLIVSFPAPDPSLLTDRKLVDWLVAHGKKAAPLVRWLSFATV